MASAQEVKEPSPKKEAPAPQKSQAPEKNASLKNKKYEDFMKYMEDIEEEVSG